jgi:antitoxin ParD1/3/4
MPNVHLTKPMQEFAEAQIESGAYANLSEIVRAGMRTLMERDRARAFYALKTELEEAIAEAEAGARRAAFAPFDLVPVLRDAAEQDGGLGGVAAQAVAVLHDQGVAGNNFLFEFAVVNLHKIGIIFTGRQTVDGKDSPSLCKGFNLQNTRHYRVSWKMPGKKRLVERYILDTDNMGIAQLNNLVNQQKGVPVWKYFFNLCGIVYRLLVGVINRHVFHMLVFLDVLLDLPSKLNIAAVSRSIGNDV